MAKVYGKDDKVNVDFYASITTYTGCENATF